MGMLAYNLNMQAVYWAIVGRQSNARPIYGTPVQINCWWIDIVREFRTLDGEVRVSKAQVYTDTDINEDGVLWLGALASLNSQDVLNPFLNPGAAKVYRFDKTQGIDPTEYLRVAWL